VIGLAAVVVAALALFGTGLSRLALQDLEALEAGESAQRAAEAAAGRAADLVLSGAAGPDIDAGARDEATRVATTNLARGSLATLSLVRGSSATDLVTVDLTLTATYGGYAGPFSATVHGVAAVPLPAGP
jgi:hypothetical protein